MWRRRFRDALGVAPEVVKTCASHPPAGHQVQGDPVLLRQALQPPAQRGRCRRRPITVGARLDDGVRLTIRNDGPVVPEDRSTRCASPSFAVRGEDGPDMGWSLAIVTGLAAGVDSV